jgi:hypothetical protein
MAANSENLEGSRESPATSPSNPADNVESSEAKANSGEAEVVSPEPTQPEPSEAFLRLKAHCESQGLKGDIDLVEPFENVSIEFKNGRNIRTVYIMSEEDARALPDHPLGDFVFLGGLSAICSYKGGWIEAAIRAHGTGPASRVGLRGIFGTANREDEPNELVIPGGNGMTLRLTEKPGALSLLGYNGRLYLRIEGIGITEHDRALNLLEDLSNTLFM